MGKPGTMTYKQKKFVKSLTSGKDIHDSLVDAKLTTISHDSYGYQLLKKPQIIAALDKAGMSESYISEQFKKTIDAGVKNSDKTATADTALRGIELYYRVHGMLSNTQYNQDNTVNIQYNELKVLDTQTLLDKVKQLTEAIHNNT